MKSEPGIARPAEKGLTERLLASLQQDEFVLYSQTIDPVGRQSEDRLFQEVFVRFSEEDSKLLPPGSFFPLLEEYRLLPYLDRWVVNRLARWVRSALRIDPGWKVPRTNVNLSAETVADPTFGSYILQYVDNAYLSGGALGFEISWDVAMNHREALLRLIAELRPYGCTFTLTDFDGSDSSLEQLAAFNPDFVKFDASTLDPSRLNKTIGRCHSQDCKTIVEYVESEDVLKHLRDSKIDFAQGFAVSPVEAL
jgi:EAL domain-containing protein (putative c-di-GMP-specific phosphodiesterase class I)